MDSPYNRNKYKKRTTKRKTNTDILSSQDINKIENSKSSTNKKNKNNIIKSGDPTDTRMAGKELFE